jgi:NADPH:quinone reductase-like Zn-dependent oxidoreductase
MRAVSVSEYRGDAQLGEHDDPTAGPGQLLIKIHAAGMNPMDNAIASGAFSEVFPATFPLILGVDVAGVIEAVGEGPSTYSVGDRIFGQLLSPPLGTAGAYADYAAVGPDATVAVVPDAVSNEVAAALPTPGVTALQLARAIDPVEAKTVALVGAGGAVGGFLTQLLAASGARVLAVAMPTQLDRVRGYGAQVAIDAAVTSVADQIRGASPGGVDILVDLVSDPEQFATLADVVRSGGTAVSSRYAGHVDDLANKNIRGVNFVVKVTTADLQTVAELTASGQLAPPPIRTVRIEDVPALLNSGGDGFDGKTVVRQE